MSKQEAEIGLGGRKQTGISEAQQISSSCCGRESGERERERRGRL